MEAIYSNLVDKIKNNELVFFIGAGASFDAPAKLPISSTLFKEFASRVLSNESKEERIELISKIKKGIRFEVFLRLFTNIIGESSVEMLKILESGKPNFNHLFMAQLAYNNLSPMVITTNFDSLLEKALYYYGVNDFDFLYNNNDFKNFQKKGNAFKVIKLHGSLKNKVGKKSYDSVFISINQVGKVVPKAKQETLKYILKNYHIVFMGYSGMDDFDLLPIFLTTKSNKSIYWINHKIKSPLSFILADEIRRHSEQYIDSNYGKILSSRKGGIPNV